MRLGLFFSRSLSPSHYIYQTYPLALLFFFLYKIPIRRCYERTKKTNAARFESPLGSNRSKRTHFHFQSRLFLFLSFFQLVCHFLPESVKQFNTKIKINFVITLNLQPPTLRTDSSAFSVSWKRVINKGKVEGQNFPTHTHTHPKKRERDGWVYRDSIHVPLKS